VEGIWARRDVDLVGNCEDGLETDALLACRFVCPLHEVKESRARRTNEAPCRIFGGFGTPADIAYSLDIVA
jgi:hypothetical protein